MHKNFFECLSEEQRVQWITQTYGTMLLPTKKDDPFMLRFSGGGFVSFSVDVDGSLFDLKIMDQIEGERKRQGQMLNRLVAEFNSLPLSERAKITLEKIDKAVEPVRPAGVKEIIGAPAWIVFTDGFIVNEDGSPDGWGIRYRKSDGKITDAVAARMKDINDQLTSFAVAHSVVDTRVAN